MTEITRNQMHFLGVGRCGVRVFQIKRHRWLILEKHQAFPLEAAACVVSLPDVSDFFWGECCQKLVQIHLLWGKPLKNTFLLVYNSGNLKKKIGLLDFDFFCLVKPVFVPETVLALRSKKFMCSWCPITRSPELHWRRLTPTLPVFATQVYTKFKKKGLLGGKKPERHMCLVPSDSVGIWWTTPATENMNLIHRKKIAREVKRGLSSLAHSNQN